TITLKSLAFSVVMSSTSLRMHQTTVTTKTSTIVARLVRMVRSRLRRRLFKTKRTEDQFTASTTIRKIPAAAATTATGLSRNWRRYLLRVLMFAVPVNTRDDRGTRRAAVYSAWRRTGTAGAGL